MKTDLSRLIASAQFLADTARNQGATIDNEKISLLKTWLQYMNTNQYDKLGDEILLLLGVYSGLLTKTFNTDLSVPTHSDRKTLVIDAVTKKGLDATQAKIIVLQTWIKDLSSKQYDILKNEMNLSLEKYLDKVNGKLGHSS